MQWYTSYGVYGTRVVFGVRMRSSPKALGDLEVRIFGAPNRRLHIGVFPGYVALIHGTSAGF